MCILFLSREPFLYLYFSNVPFSDFGAYMLFILWTAQDKEKISLSEFSQPLEKLGIKEKLTKTAAVCAIAAFAAINLYWDSLSYYREIKLPYDPARSLAQWIKDNGLEDSKLLAARRLSSAYGEILKPDKPET